MMSLTMLATKKGQALVQDSGFTLTGLGCSADARSYTRRYRVTPRRRRVLAGLLAIVLCGMVVHHVRAADSKRFDIEIAKGAVAKNKQTLRVMEGDRVEISFTGDRKLTLHLHGVDVETTITPGKTAVMRFDATVAGRFPVEAHGASGHRTLLYVEVHPR